MRIIHIWGGGGSWPYGADEAEGRDAGEGEAEGGEADGHHHQVEDVPRVLNRCGYKIHI